MTEPTAEGTGRTAVYVYGIVPGDVEVEPGTAGVGDPPGEVRAIRHGDLTALVSDVNLGRPLGRAEDLVAHQELLDTTAAVVPVLPMRFGAVMASDEAVAEELLAPHQDEFTAAVQYLDGHAQYVVRGRYVEQALLAEVLAENPEAEELRQEVSQGDPDATRDQRIQLGMIINDAVEAKRQADTRALADALTGRVASSALRTPTHELDAVYVAFLVETDKAEALEEALAGLADEWRDRIELRLIGPMAAYDFVAETAPSADAPAGAR